MSTACAAWSAWTACGNILDVGRKGFDISEETKPGLGLQVITGAEGDFAGLEDPAEEPVNRITE